jgi:hypothetical protein
MASKIQERIYVEAFLARLNEPHVIITDRESPDFLVAVGDEQFGLEVAQVFRDQASAGGAGSPAKAVESQRSKFLRQLSLDYYAAGGLPLHVQALFSDPLAVKQHGLVQRIKGARPSVPWARTRIEGDGFALRLVSLPPDAGQYTCWVCVDNSVGWRGQIGPADLLPVIQDKASRLAMYRSAVARVELLLVVDGTRASGMVRWDAAQPLPSLHGFDAIHLYFHPKESLRIGCCDAPTGRGSGCAPSDSDVSQRQRVANPHTQR